MHFGQFPRFLQFWQRVIRYCLPFAIKKYSVCHGDVLIFVVRAFLVRNVNREFGIVCNHCQFLSFTDWPNIRKIVSRGVLLLITQKCSLLNLFIKWCSVPLCKNPIKSTQSKIFVTVPRDEKKGNFGLVYHIVQLHRHDPTIFVSKSFQRKYHKQTSPNTIKCHLFDTFDIKTRNSHVVTSR